MAAGADQPEGFGVPSVQLQEAEGVSAPITTRSGVPAAGVATNCAKELTTTVPAELPETTVQELRLTQAPLDMSMRLLTSVTVSVGLTLAWSCSVGKRVK